MNTTLAGLRALNTPSLTEIYQTTDYGGGQWYYDSTDTTSTDNTGTVVVSGTYRFKRVFTEDTINALWFGIKGDNQTDNTTLIQNAVSYIYNRGGGTIFFPNGIYISGTITLYRGVRLAGQSIEGTTLKMKNGNNADFIQLINAEYAGIKTLLIDGNRQNNTTGNAITLKGLVAGQPNPGDRCRGALITDIKILNAPQNGVRTYFGAWAWRFDKLRVDGSGDYAFYNEATDSNVIDLECNENDKGGVYETGASMHWHGGKWIYNGWTTPGSGGLVLETASRIIINHVEFQDNYYDGVVIKNSSDIHLNNVLIDGNGAARRTANVNHPGFQDLVTKSYGARIIDSVDIAVYGTATNYIFPAGQLADSYIENSRRIFFKVQSSYHDFSPIEIFSQVERMSDNNPAFSSTRYNTGIVTDSVNWRTIYTLKSDVADTANHSFSLYGYITSGNTFGNGIVRRYPFQISYVGANATNPTDSITLYLTGLNDDILRIVKNGTNDYELQVKALTNRTTAYEVFRSFSTTAGANDGMYIDNIIADAGDVTFINKDNATANTDAPLQAAALSAYATLQSPSFTGTPTTPNVAINDNSNKIVNTSFLQNYVTKGTSQVITGTKQFSGGAVQIEGAAATSRDIVFSTSGVNRWFIRNNAEAETGANTGSTLEVLARADDGTNLGAAITIKRATRIVNFSVSPTAPTASPGTNNMQLATTAFVLANSSPAIPAVEVTSTTHVAAVNTKYITNNASLVSVTLPATAALGQQVIIRGKGAGGWKVTQNTGQVIHGVTDTTTGTTGSIASQNRYNTVVLECITANTEWVVVSQTGTLTIN
jgi:hypothetical protein